MTFRLKSLTINRHFPSNNALKFNPRTQRNLTGSALTQHRSIEDLRSIILKRAELDYLDHSKCHASVYHWSPYQDIIDTNNKMKNIEQLQNEHYLNDVSAVLSPFLKHFDLKRMQNYRLDSIRKSLRNNNCDVGLFFDPTNIRYITDVPNMQVWTKGNPFRYVVVSADERDPVLLYDFKAAEHLGLSSRPDLLQTVYKSKVPIYWVYGNKENEYLNIFTKDLLQQIDTNFAEFAKNKSNINLAVDGNRTNVIMALMNESRFNVMDGFKCAEEARNIKNYDEYLCLKLSVEVANIASYRMKEFLNTNMSNGSVITDNEVFAILSGTNIEYGGEYLECKLLGSGQRSNPWYQESSNHPIQHETLLSFDTDMIGPFGYCADFSRSFYTGHSGNNDKPKDETFYSYCKSLYNIAFEQVQYNMDKVKPGMSYKELEEKLWKCPDKYFDQRYTCVLHGVGSCDEYPCIMEASEGFSTTGDDIIMPGTCLSVESYIGEVGGKVGVKLEDQIFVHEDRIEVLSTFPYETDLLVPQM